MKKIIFVLVFILVTLTCVSCVSATDSVDNVLSSSYDSPNSFGNLGVYRQPILPNMHIVDDILVKNSESADTGTFENSNSTDVGTFEDLNKDISGISPGEVIILIKITAIKKSLQIVFLKPLHMVQSICRASPLELMV